MNMAERFAQRNTWRWVSLSKKGKEGKERSRDGCHRCNPELTTSLKRREESGCLLHSLQPCGAERYKLRGSCLNSQYVLWLIPVTGQRKNAKVRRKLSGSWHGQAKKKTTQSYGTWLPHLTIPELAVGPRRSCSSECWLSWTLSAALRTGEAEVFFPEWQAHTATNLSDRC